MERLSLLTILFLCLAVPGRTELLENGDFQDDELAPWVLRALDGYGYKATTTVKGDGVCHVKTGAATNHDYLRLIQDVDLDEATTYILRFEAKTDGEAKVMRTAMHWHSKDKEIGWRSAGLGERAVLGADWTPVSHTFTTTEAPRRAFGRLLLNIGALDGDVWFRNVSLVKE